MHHLDPHERPPDSIRNVYKKYQKMKAKDIDLDGDIIDLSSDASASSNPKVRVVKEYTAEDLTAIFRSFAGDGEDGGKLQATDLARSVPVYEHEDMPGLHITPSLLPLPTQSHLLSTLLHTSLSTPTHLTNIHTHYTLSYPSSPSPSSPSSPSSFFSLPPHSPHPIATPLTPTIHKPLTISQLLNKKLRWTTLGGQYDWTAKKYPDTLPPPFPPDVKDLLEGLYPETKAEAAIVNLYSPGDTLSVHRDVAETSSTGLVSVSLGCDAIFVLGTSSTASTSSKSSIVKMGEKGEGGEKTEEKIITLRLRSGSAVYMSGESRFAWHGVPAIVAGTCPEYLQDWPASASAEGEEDNGDNGGGEYEAWRGWMANKRVNLNVRQMFD